MPYQIDELIENQVIYQTVTGHYSLADMTSLSAEVSKMFDRFPESGGILIVNLKQMTSAHSNVIEVQKASRHMFQHPKHKLTVAFGTSDQVVVNFVANMLTSLLRQAIKVVSNETEAIKLINTKFPELSSRLEQALKEYHKRES